MKNEPAATLQAFLEQLASLSDEQRSTVLALVQQRWGLATSGEQAPSGRDGGTVREDEEFGRVGESVDAPGVRVGPYLLLEPLSSGGMATVWLAERSDGVGRPVALKLPRTWSPALGPHLSQERDLVALLEHPNIARLYDAGVSSTGRPYLAFEFVDGDTLDVVLARRPPLDVVLDLFLQTGRAVAHAHSRLVVHRDLKPRNVMVGRDGRVRLLDFGIAKLADAGVGQSTVWGGRAFTLEYASPEQLEGERVTVASDVFSLGVMLYEALTGRRPWTFTERSAEAAAKCIRTQRVVPPSERAGLSTLRGDLDAIVAKALATDVADRYQTVDAFVGDLSSYREGRPVSAQAPSLWYLTRKFVRRHRVLVAAALLVGFATVSAAGVSAYQASVARAEARRAERVKHFVEDIFSRATPRTGQGGVVTAEDLLASSTKRLATLEEEPAVAADLAILVARGFSELGQTAKGLEAAQLAVERGTKAYGAKDPRVLNARRLELQGHGFRGDYARTRALLDPLVDDLRAAGPALTRDLVMVLNMRSFLEATQEREAEALATAKEAIALAERDLGRDDEDTLQMLGFLANSYGRFNHPAEQLAVATESVERARAKWGGVRPQKSLIQAERFYAEALLFNARPADAVPVLERVVDEQRALDASETPRVRYALQRLSMAYLGVGRVKEATTLARKVVDLEAAQHNPPSQERSGVYGTLLRALVAARAFDEAAEMFDRDAEVLRAFKGTPQPVMEVLRARTLVGLGKDEGDALAEKLLEGTKLPSTLRVEALAIRAWHARLQGRLDEARRHSAAALALATSDASVLDLNRSTALCEHALERLDDPTLDAAATVSEIRRVVRQAQSPPVSLRDPDCGLAIGLLATRLEPREAVDTFDALLAAYRAADSTSVFRGEVLHGLAKALEAAGEHERAVSTRREAAEVLRRSPHPAHRALLVR